MNDKKTIVEIKNLSKSFKKMDKKPLVVLENVNFTMKEGEIVALLGKSGSGKSTLLRIVAGLSAPSSGDMLFRDKKVTKPVPGISMVFQSFALMPWLTVLQNVELGLEARGVSKEEREKLAFDAIDMIGLDGFENAYPRELSGGMKQRVGFARALVLNPDLLLMDEPFSALDILTSENLREDLLELWEKSETMKGILYVTHSIEEAVLTADRIIIFGSNPGFIRGELKINVPHPRNSQDLVIANYIDEVYRLMTTAQTKELSERMNKKKAISIGYRIPDIDVAELTGLLAEIYELQESKGSIDLPELGDEVNLDINELFPILETMSVLKLANINDGDIGITSLGKKFVDAEIIERKNIFAKLLINNIPLTKHILKVLNDRENKSASDSRFIIELEDHFSEKEAKRVFYTFIKWARYAEIISYDSNSNIITLDETD